MQVKDLRGHSKPTIIKPESKPEISDAEVERLRIPSQQEQDQAEAKDEFAKIGKALAEAQADLELLEYQAKAKKKEIRTLKRELRDVAVELVMSR